MGREFKPGLDRTQFDTNFARKPASLRIRQKFGLEGLAVLYEVIVWINEDKGCYVEAPTIRTAAENFAMTRLFDVSKIGWVEEVFEEMLEVGFFDREAFESDKILTSEGIVRRWILAKRHPESYPLPASVQRFRNEQSDETTSTETAQQRDINPQQSDIKTQQRDINPQQSTQRKEKKRKVQTNKQTNKTREEKCSNNSAPIPDLTEAPLDGVCETPPATLDPEPEPVTDPIRILVEAMDDPRWDEVRLRIARMIYSQHLSADLVDLFAAAAVRKWISVPQVRNWVQEAREKSKLYSASRGHAGKAKLWETLRPLLEDVFLAHGMTLPVCDPDRREPPPEPDPTSSVDKQYDPATRAGRRVMATV